jgi:hypothetical protein
MIAVLMRSQDHPDSGGWIARLKAQYPDYRVTSRPCQFGRINYSVKAGAAGIILTQGVSSENKTTFSELSDQQREILLNLKAFGIVSKMTGE